MQVVESLEIDGWLDTHDGTKLFADQWKFRTVTYAHSLPKIQNL